MCKSQIVCVCVYEHVTSARGVVAIGKSSAHVWRLWVITKLTHDTHRLAGLSLMHVTDLLINGILRVWLYDGDDCLGFFLYLWCRIHNSMENRFATTKPASFSTQARATYYVTCSLIEMINMLVWVQTGWVCTTTHVHSNLMTHASTQEQKFLLKLKLGWQKFGNSIPCVCVHVHA